MSAAERALAAEFPMLEFDHLWGHWWHDGPKDERGVAVEPDDVVADRIAAFSAWLADVPGSRIAIIGHGTFFYRLTGHHFANCEIKMWQA